MEMKTPDNFDLMAAPAIKFAAFAGLFNRMGKSTGSFEKGVRAYSYKIASNNTSQFWNHLTRNELWFMYRKIFAEITPEFAVIDVYGETPLSVTPQHLPILEQALQSLHIKTSDKGSWIKFFDNVSLGVDDFTARLTQDFFDLVRPTYNGRRTHVIRGYDLDFDLSAPSIMPLYTFIESALYENSNPKTAGRFTLRKLAEHIPKLRCAPKGKITQKLIDVHLVRPLNALQSAGIDYRLEWRSHCRPSAPPKITRANFSKVLVVIDPQFPIWTKQDDLLKSAANKSIEIEIDAEREAA